MKAKPVVPKQLNGIIHWENFQTNLESLQRIEPLSSEGTIDTAIRVLTHNIANSIKNATKTPKHAHKNSHIPPSYILDLIKEKRTLRRLWQRTREPQLKQRVNRLTHTINRELDVLRIENYNNLISVFETNDPGMWKTTRKITKKYEEIPTLVNNTPVTTDEVKVNLFADYLENTFIPHIHPCERSMRQTNLH